MLRGPAMKEKRPFDDWGPVPEPPASAWEWLWAAGEALLVAVVFTLGMSVLLLCVVYVVVLAIAAFPFVVVLAILLCPSRSCRPATAPAKSRGRDRCKALRQPGDYQRGSVAAFRPDFRPEADRSPSAMLTRSNRATTGTGTPGRSRATRSLPATNPAW